MKKLKIAAAAMSLILLMTGCKAAGDENMTERTTEQSETTEGTKLTVSAKTADEPSDGSYRFEYKQFVVSDMFRDTMGEDMYEAYSNFIAAIENEDTEFECADEDTFNWMMGQYAYSCNPCVAEFVEADYYADGVGHFYYTIPEDEFRVKLQEWEDLVTGIINGCGIQEDDSDLEKALLIYLYISENYVYDYDAAENAQANELSAYRLFTEGHGICQEIGIGYAYLLMQVGVDAAGCEGWSDYMTVPHEWTIVHIGDNYYHVDPTFALGKNTLDLFLMSDDDRYLQGGYSTAQMRRVNLYPYEMDENFVSPYVCDDELVPTFEDTYYLELDHENNIIYYASCEEGCGLQEFDFSDYI
ncbi:hypothetical protein SAMN05216413_1020 [Ruminococcaceae bacterium KH2T8]|nr:hypothetical protein SAMN05216413_1020 [Ruminococcaceae bacterium KH2T8]